MTFADRVVGITLLIVSLLLIIFQGYVTSGDGSKYIEISVDGELYGRYEFSDKEKTVDVSTEFGENSIKINNKAVWVEDASCPDKLDVKMGKIEKKGQMIVCLPNRLMVKISGNNEKVDKVTY
jgi:hypothetical protein